MYVNYLIDQGTGFSCIQVIGEVDYGSIGSFGEQITQAALGSKSDLLIDCSQLTYIDSRGLNILASLCNRLNSEHRNIRLLDTNENIYRLLRITGLGKLANIAN